MHLFFFFQAEDGIRDKLVTGVQTCALPISPWMMQDGAYFYNPPAMTYREHAPAPRLAEIVDRIWTLEATASEFGDADQPVLPDGRPELILHFGDRFKRVEADGSSELQAASI